VSGVSLPCHFSERKGVMLTPELDARVSLLDKNNQVVARLGDDQQANDWRYVRKQAREQFRSGRFVCPYGASFDRAGNIFVVERVEIGRVTRLRHVG
jgi:hypothetical protein